MALEFQSARRAVSGEPVSFVLDGESFRVSPEIAGMALLDLGSASDLDHASSGGLRAIRDFLRSALADDAEWERFRDHTYKHRTSADTLLAIVQELMPVLTGRPTMPPSVSPDILSPNTTTRKVVSFSRGTVEEQPETTTAASSS